MTIALLLVFVILLRALIGNMDANVTRVDALRLLELPPPPPDWLAGFRCVSTAAISRKRLE